MEAVEGISAEEHRERQGRLRAAAADRGLQAVVAFSRGGERTTGPPTCCG